MSLAASAVDPGPISDLDGDTLREECGVFGIFGHPDASAIVALGLHALQHRGQEAAGIVSFDGSVFHSERRPGLVGDSFSDGGTIERLKGRSAIGHVRYSTTGGTILRNVQPLFAELASGGLAVAHNGNLTNALSIRRDLVRDGAITQSTSDTEVILHLAARSRKPRIIERFIDALQAIEGAYAIVALTNKKLIGARDPLGIRPLVLGELDGRYMLASETCALDIIGARFVRDIENGEVVVISEEGIESIRFADAVPDAAVHLRVHLLRPAGFGRERQERLRGAQEHRPRARPRGCRAGRHRRAGAGFRRARGPRLRPGDRDPLRDGDHPQPLCRPDLHPADPIGARTRRADEAFGQPRGHRGQAHRARRRQPGARHHLGEDRPDDARGRRRARCISGSPRRRSPIPDFYGIDTPEREKLLAATHDLEGMRNYIGADSLAFLSIPGLYRAMGEEARDEACPQYTDHCFTGDYPTGLTDLSIAGPKRFAMLAEAD